MLFMPKLAWSFWRDGTCADSTWRDELIPKLLCSSFNPVVENWTRSAIKKIMKIQ